MKEKDYKKREEERLKKMVGKYHRKRGKDFSEATAKYKRGLEDYIGMEAAVKEILDRSGESIALRWAYLAFARKTFRLLREGKYPEAESLILEWEKKRLKGEVLKEIYNKCQSLAEAK